jgi:PPOX class probable F420-dependent enzyme
MQTMSNERWRAFITYGTRTGKLATVRADGRPHVVPLWFALDGDELVFQSERAAVKARNLVRDPRFALTVDNDRPPYAFVTIQGRATISDDPDEVRYWAGRLGARYIGQDRAEEYAARNGGPDIIVIRGNIDKVIALDGIAD